HGRHGHRHPPDPHAGRDVQGSRAAHRRRGAALRRGAPGRTEEAQDQRRHPRDERDADPAHARDGRHGDPRDVDARDAARGAAPDPVVRRAVEPQADRRRELLREGQVFYVHNRVTSIQRVASHLAELVPEARIAVAHGKMSENQLEQVVDDFWERKFDVLVCTTIIETGIDIQNANTIIIDRADKYGLAQLHQLRGRVGRGRERAYAYFVYDEQKPLSETAADRLETIAVHNDLGSGIQVAMKDLELRGAGNLLGAEQAGHIEGVGFDLYLRMIGEAVSEFRGEDTEGPVELRLELPIEARIPESYIDSERLRLEAYQKLSAAATAQADDDAIDRVVEELTDRYGEPPVGVTGLAALARLRRRAAQSHLSGVVAMGKNLRIAPGSVPDSMQVRLKRLYPGAKGIGGADALLVPLPAAGGELLEGAELLAWVRRLLDALFPLSKSEDAPADQ